MTQAVDQSAPPAAVDQRLQVDTIAQEQSEQLHQVRRRPIAPKERFRHSDIAGLEHFGEEPPVVQAKVGVGATLHPESTDGTVGKCQ